MDLRQPLKRLKTETETGEIVIHFTHSTHISLNSNNNNENVNGINFNNNNTNTNNSISNPNSRFGSPVPQHHHHNQHTGGISNIINNNSNKMFFHRNGPVSVSPTPSSLNGGCGGNNNNNGGSSSSSMNYYYSTTSTTSTFLNNNNNINREVEPDTPTERLSRHVPNRDEMDLNMSSMNLVDDSDNHHTSNHNNNQNLNNSSGGGLLLAVDAATNNNNLSMLSEGSFSFVIMSQNDTNNNNNNNNSNNNADSSLLLLQQQQQPVNSIEQENSNESFTNYRDSLADSFLSTSSNGGRSRLGGDVLSFNLQQQHAQAQAQGQQQHQQTQRMNNHNNNGSYSPTPVPSSSSSSSTSAVVNNNNINNGGGVRRSYHHLANASASKRSSLSSAAGGLHHHHHRALNLNPEKVLDAPDLPAEPLQLLDWGSNNELVIGLNSTLYSWNATTGEPRTVCDLSSSNSNDDDEQQQPQIITGVNWLSFNGTSSAAAAMVLDKNRIALVDANKGTIFRYMLPGIDAGLTCDPNLRLVNSMTVCGPLIACATSLGTVCLYDIRKPNLAGHFDAHSGGISKAVFCSQEPNYLATGGSMDGCVRLWDYRSTSVARYNFDRVFHPHNNNNNNIVKRSNIHNNNNSSNSSSSSFSPSSVTAISFFADKRSIIFAGSSDGHLLGMNTHGGPEDFIVSSAFCGSAPITSILSSAGTGEIATSHGVGGGVVQLRRANKFQHLGSFCGPGTNAAINCLALAPDGERVCGAQLDETLKFWKIFDRSSARMTFSTATNQQQQQQGQNSYHHTRNENLIINPGDRIRPRQVHDDDFAVDDCDNDPFNVR